MHTAYALTYSLQWYMLTVLTYMQTSTKVAQHKVLTQLPNPNWWCPNTPIANTDISNLGNQLYSSNSGRRDSLGAVVECYACDYPMVHTSFKYSRKFYMH